MVSLGAHVLTQPRAYIAAVLVLLKASLCRLSQLALNPKPQTQAVKAGTSTTVVIMQDGSVRAFGSNSKGALGLGDADHRGDDPGEMGANLPAVPQTLS